MGFKEVRPVDRARLNAARGEQKSRKYEVAAPEPIRVHGGFRLANQRAGSPFYGLLEGAQSVVRGSCDLCLWRRLNVGVRPMGWGFILKET